MNFPKNQSIGPDSLLTSYQVGSLLQVNPSSVNKWVKDGRIPAFRTPGGHRRIRASDLVAFLNEHHMPVPRSLANAARRRLLVVDDEAKDLESIQRLLKAYSGQIDLRTIDNGIDALLQIGSFQPHVVVLDVIMPQLDGLEVCRRLKAREDTKDITVVVTSARMTPDVEAQAKEAGAAAAIGKPVDVSLILEMLDVPEQPQFMAAGQ